MMVTVQVVSTHVFLSTKPIVIVALYAHLTQNLFLLIQGSVNVNLSIIGCKMVLAANVQMVVIHALVLHLPVLLALMAISQFQIPVLIFTTLPTSQTTSWVKRALERAVSNNQCQDVQNIVLPHLSALIINAIFTNAQLVTFLLLRFTATQKCAKFAPFHVLIVITVLSAKNVFKVVII